MERIPHLLVGPGTVEVISEYNGDVTVELYCTFSESPCEGDGMIALLRVTNFSLSDTGLDCPYCGRRVTEWMSHSHDYLYGMKVMFDVYIQGCKSCGYIWKCEEHF